MATFRWNLKGPLQNSKGASTRFCYPITNDATPKQIEAVKVIDSNGSHVWTSSHICRFSNDQPTITTDECRYSFPHAKVKFGPYEFQIRPLRVKTGQYPSANRDGSGI